MSESGGVREQMCLIEQDDIESVEVETSNTSICVQGKGACFPYLARVENYPSRRLLRLFPYTLASQYRCVPIGVERGAVTIVTCQQLASEVLSQFQERTNKVIFQVRTEELLIDELLNYWRDLLFLG